MEGNRHYIYYLCVMGCSCLYRKSTGAAARIKSAALHVNPCDGGT